MNPYIRPLASLTLSVILLLAIALLLSLGTILESLHGAEAGRAVYYAPWFFALQALFALNIMAALWERWPQNRYRIGFLITHSSMLLILELQGYVTSSPGGLYGRVRKEGLK